MLFVDILQKPTSVHVTVVKQIFKYIKGIIDVGILYKSTDIFDFVGFSNADYAGDSETRRSTSSYVFHLMVLVLLVGHL